MKTTLIAVAAAITALSCQAITFPFTVTAPTWNKVAECTTEGGVNVRKFPSTSAPKMVLNENKIEAYDVPAIYYAYWSTKTGGPIQPVTFQYGYAPVISEKPGWLELYNQGPKAESNGWVSSKFCKVHEVIPIKPSDNPFGVNFMTLNFKDVEGSYAMYFVPDEMNGWAYFYIGRLDNGKVVCPYVFLCDYYEDRFEETGQPQFEKDSTTENGYKFTSTQACMTTVKDNPDDEFGTLYTDIHKIPTEVLNFAIQHATKLDTPATIFLSNGIYSLVE